MTEPQERIGGCTHCHADRAHRRGDRTVRFECGSYVGPQGIVQSPECKLAVAYGGWQHYQAAQNV